MTWSTMRINETRNNQGGLTGRTVNGALWAFLGAASEVTLHWVIFIVLARLLGPQDFGVYTLGSVVIGFSRVFGEIGLGPSLVQRRELDARYVKSAFSATLALSILTSLAIIVLAPAIAAALGTEELTAVIRVLSVLFLIRGIILVPRSLLQRELRFSKLARSEVISYGLGYGVVGIALAFLGYGYWALVWASIVEASLLCIQFLFLQPYPKKLRIYWTALRELLSFGVGISVGRVGNYLAMKGDYLIVGRFMGVAPLGIYSRAYELMAVPVGLFQQVVDRALFPAVAIVQGDHERLSRGYLRASSISALLLLPTGMVLFVLAPEIVLIVLGDKWTGAIAPLRIIALGMFFRSGYQVGAVIVKGVGDVHRLASRQWLYAGLVLIGAWAGHFYGIVGVSVGVVLAIALQFVSISHLAMRNAGVSAREFLQAHVPSMITSIIILILVWISASLTRGLDFHPAMTLFVSLSVCAITLGVIIRVLPLSVGEHGVWVLEAISHHLPWKTPSSPLRNPQSMSHLPVPLKGKDVLASNAIQLSDDHFPQT